MRLLKSYILLTGILIPAFKSNAQLCQGSLGDPIVNITFGAGPNPGAPLTAATTTYSYSSADCPNDGFYTVRNNSTDCFGSSWHTLNADHTGVPNGYFMLVNASVQPSAFYLDTVKGLCSNTTYEFAAWILNILKTSACGFNGNQPNLTFTIEKIDGTVLKSYNTGNIASGSFPSWQQFGFFFATPPGVFDVVLRIFNNAPGGCGNDLALDDITFRPCGPLLSASISGTPYSGDTLCKGTARNYTFNCTLSAGFNNPSFQWQESINGNAWQDIVGATTMQYNKNFTPANSTGTYAYRLTAAETGNISSAKCRVSSQTLTIRIADYPAVTYFHNSPVCENDNWQISFTAPDSNYVFSMTGPQNATWNGLCCGNKTSFGIQQVNVTNAGNYYIVNTNSYGCTKKDTAVLLVHPVPTATVSFPTVTICNGASVQLGGSGGNTYQWIPSAGLSAANIANPFAKPADTTAYRLVVYNQFGCTDTADILVNVIERPGADAGPDKTIIKGGSVQLSAAVSGQDVSFYWTPAANIDNVLALQPVVNPPVASDYLLTVVSNLGCGSTDDKVHVFVYNDFYVPNAFSPNNDGLNDSWNLPAITVFKEYEVSVFNRLGQRVYHAVNNFKPWDGSFKGVAQEPGVYVYVIDFKQQFPLHKGSLLLIR